MMGPTTEEERRIRGYLTAQGAKLAPAEIVDKVRAAMAELRAAAVAVPAGRFDDRPAPGEWSGGEVMAHVAESGRRVGERIAGVLDGCSTGALEAEATGAPAPGRSAAGWFDELARDREALFARVLAAPANAHLDVTTEISAFGPLDWRAMLLFLRVHDLDHAGQLRKIAAALA
jgi:hypothetical protein